MKKTALIIGANGQDGKILFDFLVGKKYKVIGIDRDVVRTNGLKRIRTIDITDSKAVFRLVKRVEPDEIYYLAAFHHSSEDKPEDNLVLLNKSYAIHVYGFAYFLEAIRIHSSKTRIFYAASSLIFGSSSSGKQNENTPFNPDSFYAISKLDGLFLCRFYRSTYGLFVSAGILYNHESAYRQEKFISRKILQGAIDIKNKKRKTIKVGNLESEGDWGYAPDYMDAAHKILGASVPDDFIIATGRKHTVADFAQVAFGYFGLDYKKYVVEDKKLLSRKRSAALGDSKKLAQVTGWKPSVDFREMIIKIIKELDI